METSLEKPAAGPAIDEAEIAEYEQKGAVCLRGLFDEYWIDRLRSAVENRIALARSRPSKKAAHASFTDLFMWQEDRDFRDFVFDSPAAAIAKTMMRSRSVRFYFDQLFVKEPQTAAPSPWHHDQPFWPVSGNQVCSIWLALDPVTKASSGLEYVAGSHLWGKRFKPGPVPPIPGFDGDEDVTPDIEAERDMHEFLNWDMEPGDCLVHHGLTMHGAGGNTTIAVRRRAHATRWLGDDATYRAGGGHEPLKVDGLQTGDAFPADRFPPVSAPSLLNRG